jgi:LysR family positive regulator for ilvC
MDQHDLRTFLALAETLHFGRASRLANLSPSALSRAVRRMEEELGRALFTRDNRSVELTPAGRSFRRYAREALAGWEELGRELAGGGREVSGELTVYCSVAAAYTVLTGLFRSFRQAHPGVHLRLQTGDPAEALERVAGGQADVTVAARPHTLPRALAFKTVAVTPLLFIAPTVPCEADRLARRSPIPWELMPMVLSATGLSRRRADAWFRARGVHPHVYAEVSGHEAIISMVRLGCGVGIVPRLVLERFAQRSEVRLLEVSPPLEPYVVGLCARRRRLDYPPARAFWEAVTEADAQEAESSRPLTARS